MLPGLGAGSLPARTIAKLPGAPPLVVPGAPGLGSFVQQTTGTLTPGLPSGVLPGDIMLLVVGQRGSPAWSASGWTAITQVPAFGSEGLLVFWRRHQAGDAAPVGPFDGNSWARMLAVRGCVTTGSPIEGLNNGSDTTADTAFTSGTVTTLGKDRRVFYAAARDVDDASAWLSGLAAPGLTDLTEHFDQGSTFGLGGGIALVSGLAGAPGAYGPLTATMPFAARDAWAGFALKPA